ncbi:MAG: hypothetical protein ACP6IP_04900 [Candidatus Njordarchaeia archaeon]
MDRAKFHMFLVAVIIVGIVGFYVLLSPPLKDVRVMIGLPADQPGARYNETVGAADIINEANNNVYLGRIAFVYHSVFITLLYATVIIFSLIYLEGKIQQLVMDLAGFATVTVVVSALLYSYVERNFLWHGTFIAGLALFFLVGVLIFVNFKPKNLLEWNIWLSGVLMLLGSFWGAWLGSSYMHFRHSFLEALINSRFNPDLAEENIFWRALTSHEHAMLAIALALVFFLALSITGVEEDKKLFGFLPVKWIYVLALIGQLFMGLASYAVTFFGKIAHLIITPAAILLIFATLLLSLVAKKGELLRISLVVGNVAIWLFVAAEGAITAMNLRKALFLLPIPFRDPLYDWAELAYNIGHWHLLMFSWGIILLIIYLSWPEDFTHKYKFMYWVGILTLVGYIIAMAGANLYMLANPPGEYIPNPYNNVWVTFVLEPGLLLVTLGVAISFLIYLKEYLIDFLKAIINGTIGFIKSLFSPPQ